METPTRPRHSRKPLLLIAIIAAIVALAFVAALLATGFPGRREQARTDHAMMELRKLRSALELYRSRVGRYPSAAEGLIALVDSGILPSRPMDPWGREYIYARQNGRLVVMSLGRDGLRGGSGPDEDIRLEVGPSQ